MEDSRMISQNHPPGDRPKRSLRIGITIGLHQRDETLWNNGIKQNALFLAKLFQHSPLGHEVTLLNTTDIAITDRLPWSLTQFPTKAFDDACDALDVVIELGGQISSDRTRRIKQQGTKLVSYCCGPEYVQNIEAMIFRRHMYDSCFINQEYDELWIIPQVVETSFHYLQTFRRCPARQVPFVWDPMAMDDVTASMPDHGEYRPHDQPKRCSVIEPNIDVLKFCLYPILTIEQAFRQMPARIAFAHIANADQFVHDNKEFVALMQNLDIVNANKISFIGRVKTPEFLSELTDIVISHQWGLALNYFYLECCWQGYPLIHNAHLVSDLGYYYHENDIGEAAQMLMDALTKHDMNWEAYRDRQRAMISRFLATNRELAETYDDLLFNLIENKPHLPTPSGMNHFQEHHLKKCPLA